LWSKKEWVETFGPQDAPRAPWNYYPLAGCQLGVRFSGDRVWGTGFNLAGREVRDRPIRKRTEWMANYSLSAMTLDCEKPRALFAASHLHLQCQGTGKREGGKCFSIASETAKYTPELSTV